MIEKEKLVSETTPSPTLELQEPIAESLLLSLALAILLWDECYAGFDDCI